MFEGREKFEKLERKGVDLMKICVRGIDCEESRLRSWRDVEELN